MPDMSGVRLANRIRETRPELPILFMSGFASNVVGAQEALACGTDFLQKPFTRQELEHRIRETVSNFRNAVRTSNHRIRSVGTGGHRGREG
jgi:two-component system cell cycle sensor histidine kinase/response regulator CckA